MSADALMSALDQAKPVHARWSEVNRQFLEFVAANPECLDRASYTVISQAPGLQTYASVQPWPLFFEPQRVRELAEMAVGIDGLVKAAVGRFLQKDVHTIADYYHTAPPMDGSPGTSGMVTEKSVPFLVAEPTGVAGAFSRGDYLETPEGLKLMEFNSSGFLGGLTIDHLCERYLESAPTARFLDQVNRRARPMGQRRAMLRHVVEDTRRLGVWTEGVFNVALVIYPNRPTIIAEFDEAEYTRELRAALMEAGHAPRGRVMLCSLEELSVSPKGVTLAGAPVHAVIEQHDGSGDVSPVFRAFKARRVNLFSGPIKSILSDKRNMALASEHADSADFTAAERALIERHFAWTRRVLPSRTTFRGRPLRLPDDLPAGRDDFVLKKGWSNRGDGVVVGRIRTPDEWEQAVARAVREGDWVVQERLEPVTYCFHDAHAGAVPHEVVWGLFAFGEHFGGVHLTMQPAGHGTGVVNPNQGAALGAGLALVD
ncbi:MAG TPA: hypothetical protein VLK84_30690 [Longimicrobium sp.]|nr:hypothetical protein [Longimicrobium sp.]